MWNNGPSSCFTGLKPIMWHTFEVQVFTNPKIKGCSIIAFFGFRLQVFAALDDNILLGSRYYLETPMWFPFWFWPGFSLGTILYCPKKGTAQEYPGSN